MPAPPIYVVDGGIGRHQDLTIARDIIVNPGILAVGCSAHATHVAGIIAAKPRNGGVAGILAGAPLISVQISTANVSLNNQIVCAASTPTDAAVAAGLQKVYEDMLANYPGQAAVVNLSIAGPTPGWSPPIGGNPGGVIWQKIVQLATPNPSVYYNGHYVNFKGALVVQAAGNSYYPACSEAFSAAPDAHDIDDGVLVVGGLNQSGVNAEPSNLLPGNPQQYGAYNRNTEYANPEAGSNYGSCVEIWAPSVSIKSTWGLLNRVAYSQNPDAYLFQRYYETYGLGESVALDGTSLAAPYVSGVAAAILQREPSLSSQQLETRVRTAMAARPLFAGTGTYYYPCGTPGCWLYGVVNPIASAQDDLVEHSYDKILGRPSDAGGKAFWLDDLERVRGFGADPREIYRNLNKIFFASGEYNGSNPSNSDFVTDLFWAYLNRAPDSGGLSYWTGLLNNGSLTRDAALGSFQKATEFDTYMTSKLGVIPQRAEIGLIMDAYRAFLSTQPPDNEINAWITYLRQAQCSGSAEVQYRAGQLVYAFVNDPDYAALGRTDAQFVADLYDAVLGRGADPSGYGFWVGYTTQNNRGLTVAAFLGSGEWSTRLGQIAAETCIP